MIPSLKIVDYAVLRNFHSYSARADSGGVKEDHHPGAGRRMIADLEQFGILKEITGGKRGKMYVYYD